MFTLLSTTMDQPLGQYRTRGLYHLAKARKRATLKYAILKRKKITGLGLLHPNQWRSFGTAKHKEFHQWIAQPKGNVHKQLSRLLATLFDDTYVCCSSPAPMGKLKADAVLFQPAKAIVIIEYKTHMARRLRPSHYRYAAAQVLQYQQYIKEMATQNGAMDIHTIVYHRFYRFKHLSWRYHHSQLLLKSEKIPAVSGLALCLQFDNVITASTI